MASRFTVHLPSLRGSRGLPWACAALLVACGSQTAGGTGSAAGASSGPAASSSGAAIPVGDWPTFNFDAARSGSAPASGITVADAGALRLRRVAIDGTVDSSPIELHAVSVHGARHDLVAVTTIHGETIAIDPGTGRRLWEFHPSGTNSTVTTASPVADPGRRFLYTASSSGVIHKLSVATGRQVWERRITFDSRHEKIASALTVSGPNVIAVTGGYIGDIPPYDGHVVSINRASGRIAQVWNSECSGRHQLILASSCSVTNTQGDNAIWARAGAVIEPGTNRILVATGNGPFDGHSSWGDSVLELTPDASRLLHNWTPTDQAALAHSDTDVGSTAPALLPLYHGRRLAVQGGKSGRLALLDLGRLDGTTGGAGPRLGGQLQQISAPGGSQVFAAPAVWRDGTRIIVFVGDDVGTAAYELSGGAHPRLHVLWQDGTSATSPVISGGLLYAYDQQDGKLIIRRPLSGGVVRSLPVAVGHWNSPIAVGGRVIEPTGSYFTGGPSTIDIWHLPGR